MNTSTPKSPHALIARLGLFADQALYAETLVRDADSAEITFATERWCNGLRSALWRGYVLDTLGRTAVPQPQRIAL